MEVEEFFYAIRFPKNQVLQARIAYLLPRPVGHPPNLVRRFHASFGDQAGSWNRKRRVVAKVEWRSGELYPRRGFIVISLSHRAERVVTFYNLGHFMRTLALPKAAEQRPEARNIGQ